MLLYGTDTEYGDLAYVIVTNGGDLDRVWNALDDECDEEAEALEWDQAVTEGDEETLWLEEVTAS